MDEFQIIAQKVGFNPPKPLYTKNDPRGPEYGWFAAAVHGDDTVALTHCDSGDIPIWQCTFPSVADFEAWAKTCT